MPRLGGALDIVQVTDPATPAAGRQFLYFKSDGKLYTKLPTSGTVIEIGGGGTTPALNTTYTFAAALSTYADSAAHSGYVTTANGWPVTGFLSGFRQGTSGTQRLQQESTGATWARYWIGTAWSTFALYLDAQDYTAKGSSLIGTSSGNYAELLVGTAGQTVIADPAAATGLKYVAICEPYIMAVTGALTVGTGKSRIYCEQAYAVESIRAVATTAPVGASIIVDVNYGTTVANGVTLFTTQANRPTIAAGGNLSAGVLPDVITIPAGSFISVDVDQIGSTTAGADLTVTIRLRRV